MELKKFFLIFFSVFFLDQCIKFFFYSYCNGVEGRIVWESQIFSLLLVFNKGVAFSFLSFLGEFLKFVQLFAIIFVAFILYKQKEFFLQNIVAFACIFAGGISNLLDRFVYGGVVDYVYWHYYFEFAVFNFADVVIDLGAGLLLLRVFRGYSNQSVSSSAKK